ncbi:50S ribosomal protein L16 [Candidatus Berkelbacteria bacterium]|nr:50S ribosomal protein L16 [Candidatus Berkelbacteria bacterium]
MLLPRKMKFRKQFRGGKIGRVATQGTRIAFGQYGLKATQPIWITARQIEAARRAMTRYIKREGQVWIRIFPSKPVSSQPAETGMGGGKGAVDHFVAVVKPGQVLFEMSGVSVATAKEALRLAAQKLPIKTKFAIRQ